MNQKNLLLHLSLISGIGPAAIQSILDNKNKLDLYQLGQKEFIQLFGLTELQSKKLVVGLQNTDELEKELELIAKHNINWMTLADDEYPHLLRAIHYPPSILYWQGAPPSDHKTVAIVGARKAGRYAQRTIAHVVPDLVAYGWTIISGGAYGADTMAHTSTLVAGGKTVVVLGSGLLRPYPAANEKLFESIKESGGTLLSSFPLTTDPHPGNFPTRNRIISGLSHGCFVVQAAKKSGALITAYCALEQGRDVFALPGSIEDELSAGCHMLIQQGALLVQGAQDILQALGEQVVTQKKNNVKVPTKIEKNQQIPIGRTDRMIAQKTKKTLITVEDKIVDYCDQPTNIDDIMVKSGLSLAQVQVHLFDLQLSGRIEQTISGLWVAQ